MTALGACGILAAMHWDLRSVRTSIAALAVSLSLALPAAHALTPKEQERAVSVGLRSALDARQGGRFKQAFTVLADLSRRFPDDARIQHELGVLYALHGQLKPAASRFATALRLDPLLVQSRRALAEVLRAQGRCGPALTHYAALLAQPDHRVAALRGLALCREATGDAKGAKAALAQLVRDHGDTPVGVWAKGYLAGFGAQGGLSPAAAEREGLKHFRAKRYAQASPWFELACHRGPTADRCYRLGVSRLGERDVLAAAQAFRLALAIDPKHLPSLSAWPTTARMLRAAGRGGQAAGFRDASGSRPSLRVAEAILDDDLLLAEQLASAAIAKGHKGRVLRLLRAETRLRAGQLSRAQADLSVVLRARPGLSQARHALADIYAQRRRLAQARAYAGLPQRVAPAGGWPEGVRGDADLAAFRRWRRAAMDHTLRRLRDPGLKPFPAFEPPPMPDPESVRARTDAPSSRR